MFRNNDITQMYSSFELEYLARVAAGREQMEYKQHRMDMIDKEYEGKDIPVLKLLYRGAQEVATTFANKYGHHNEVLYGDGRNTFHILRENKDKNCDYIVTVILDFDNDTVTIYTGGPDVAANIKDVYNHVETIKHGTYNWNLIEETNSLLKYKITWDNREDALWRIVDDEAYIRDLGDRLFK